MKSIERIFPHYKICNINKLNKLIITLIVIFWGINSGFSFYYGCQFAMEALSNGTNGELSLLIIRSFLTSIAFIVYFINYSKGINSKNYELVKRSIIWLTVSFISYFGVIVGLVMLAFVWIFIGKVLNELRVIKLA